MAKSEEERITELDQKIEQMKARKQRLEAQVKTKARKERTRRLIQIGAIFEKHFDLSSVKEAEVVAEALRSQAKTFLHGNPGSLLPQKEEKPAQPDSSLDD